MHQINPNSARDGEKKPGFPDSRGQIILTAIINEHFVTGEPVGSKVLADRFANLSGLSSATIRNVMGELEEMGMLEQPHTSAGRVPTDRAYRVFVDLLLEGRRPARPAAGVEHELRQRAERSPLMDAPRFARNIEAAYRTMWQRWCADSIEK